METSHDKNRNKVCATCGQKIVTGSKNLSRFKINEKTEDMIKKFSNAQFDMNDRRFPVAICSSCQTSLYQKAKGIHERHLPTMPNYQEIDLPVCTRSNDNDCLCFVCITASYKGHPKISVGKGHKKQPIQIVKASNGLLGVKENSEATNSTRKHEKKSDNSSSATICKLCLQEIGRGIPHDCNPSSCHKNILKSIENLPQKQKDNIIHSLIVSKVKQNSECKDKRSPKLNLKTGGKDAKFMLNPKAVKKVQFSEKSLDNFVSNSG